MGTEQSGAVQPLRIETPSLLLRTFTLEDAPLLYVHSNEPSARQWLPSQVCASEDAARKSIEFLSAQFSTPGDPRLGPVVFAVEHRGDGELIGHVGLSPFEGEVEIGFGIAEAYQRRGLGAEAVLAACRWAFARYGLARVLGIVAKANRGSSGLLQRVGFEHVADRVMRFQGTEAQVGVFQLMRTGVAQA